MTLPKSQTQISIWNCTFCLRGRVRRSRTATLNLKAKPGASGARIAKAQGLRDGVRSSQGAKAEGRPAVLPLPADRVAEIAAREIGRTGAIGVPASDRRPQRRPQWSS